MPEGAWANSGWFWLFIACLVIVVAALLPWTVRRGRR